MKHRMITLVVLVFIGCQNQKEMNQIETIKKTVTQLFTNTDQRNWSGVEAQLASKVTFDYSTMSGNPPAELTPEEITTAWKAVLPGFTHTHHQIGNFLVETEESKAHVFCYGVATHYLEDKGGNVWTVVGSYDFELEKITDRWRITAMTFHYKYQDGNTQLIQKAIQNQQ